MLGRGETVNTFQLSVDGLPIRTTKQICTVFNNYFANAGSGITQNFTSDGSSNFLNFMRGDYKRSLFLFTIKAEEVLNAIKSLKSKNCKSFTHTPIHELKSKSEVFWNSLSRIKSIYISNGISSQSFKKVTDQLLETATASDPSRTLIKC